jgi:hypothetical protein
MSIAKRPRRHPRLVVRRRERALDFEWQQRSWSITEIKRIKILLAGDAKGPANCESFAAVTKIVYSDFFQMCNAFVNRCQAVAVPGHVLQRPPFGLDRALRETPQQFW